MKTIPPLLLLFVLPMLVVSSLARDWKTYMSYHNCTLNIPIDNGVVYALAGGSVFTYEAGDEGVRTFSKATGLHGAQIRKMAYCPDEEAFLLIYNNGNMDVLGLNDSVCNMSEFKNSMVADKTVNDVTVDGRYAYVAMSSGVLVVDMRHCLFVNTYSFDKPVRSAACVDETIFAVTDDGVYAGKKATNLLDRANWKLITKDWYYSIVPFNDRLYGHAPDAIYAINTTNGARQRVSAGTYTYINNSHPDVLLFGNTSTIVEMLPNGTQHTFHQTNDFKSLSFDGTRYWASRGYAGLQPYVLKDGSLQAESFAVVPNSPVRDYTYWLNLSPSGKLLVGGGNLNYVNKTYAGTAMALVDGERWINFEDGDSVIAKTGMTAYDNVTSVVEDPADPNHHFVSAACGGLYEFRNGRFVHLYDHDNSPIKSILPKSSNYKYYTRTAGLTYDDEGNLWMLNNEVDTVLIIKKADGGWLRYHIPALEGYPTFDKILLDKRGFAWITHRRTTNTHYAGVLCIYHNNTPTDLSDDIVRFRHQFTNQDNTSYTFTLLYDVAEDRNGAIWFATDKGPFVLEKPEDFINSQTPVFTQVKVPRNDGTNYADYLLAGEVITCIAIDGGNRKWFGTAANGVYLISADGTQTIHHFTAENSPLLSNNINAITIIPNTGEVMIATEEGLIGYRSDATEPLPMLEDENLLIFPNPVRPDFTGSLRVDGLTADADVKITTASGQLVAQGTSVGGTFTWNLKDNRSRRVGSGVYYVVAANSEGKTGVVGKFVVIK